VLASDVVEQRPQRIVGRLEASEEAGELLLLSGRHCGERIKRREDEPLLVLAEFDVGHWDGRLTVGERQLDSKVTVNEVTGRPIDEDLGHPADFGQGAANGPLLVVRMGVPVPRVGYEIRRRDVVVPDDPISPNGSRRRRHGDPRTCNGWRSERWMNVRTPHEQSQRRGRRRWRAFEGASVRPSSGSSPTTPQSAISRASQARRTVWARMCKAHWNMYTAALARDAKARKAAAEAEAGAATEADPVPGPTPKRPRRAATPASALGAQDAD